MAQCAGSLCVHVPPVQSVCVVLTRSDVKDTQREDKEEKERKSVWEKGEKEKQPLQKPKHANQKTTLFSLFFFSL